LEVYHFCRKKNLIELKLIDGVPTNRAVGAPFFIGEFSGKCYNIMVNIVGFVFSVYINRKRFYRGDKRV